MATRTLPWHLLVGTTTRRARRDLVVVAAWTLAALAAVTGVASAEPRDDRLSTTLIGALEPGGEPRLAVRWDGEHGALLEVWVDLDGDERLTDEELIVDGRPLQPGIEVVGLEIPAEGYVVSEPRLWVRAVEPEPLAVEQPAEVHESAPSREGCAWQPGFLIEDLDDVVIASAVYDDGSGPALFAGGYFTTASGLIVNYVAKWDGTAWSALSGPSGTGVDDHVYELAVYDDGNGSALIAGGYFTTAGGVTVNHVARWDGTAWSALSGPSGCGVSGGVSALAVYDDGSGPALYAGGYFSTAGGVAVNHIARWDGTAWAALTGASGTGVDNYVRALAAYDDGSGPALYAGGDFTSAGGVTVNRVARWDGTAWSALSGPSGTGMNEDVFALAAYDDGSGPALFAGGHFTTAGGVAVNYIARWDGTAWSALSGPSGMGVSDWVEALGVYDDGFGPALYAGGWFVTAGGVTVYGIARWDGTAWSALSGPLGTGVGGAYEVVYALAVYDDGNGPVLYPGGGFTTAGGVSANRIARWDGTAWTALSEPSGAGMDNSVSALAVHNDGSGPALYAGGRFITAGGVVVNRIARWDGTAWSALTEPSGTGMNGSVYALAVYDDGSGPALYAGGEFTRACGAYVERIARWDGTAWSGLGGGVSHAVHALAVYNDGTGPALFAGGRFLRAGGAVVNRIAKWDGTHWSAVSGGVGGTSYPSVESLAVYDDGSGPKLFVGGDFTTAGGVTVNYIASWAGAWSALSGPAGTGVSEFVYALAVHDDGSGPALYAGGSFSTAGGVVVNNIARWDGTAWSALTGPSGTGVGGPVYALAVHDEWRGAALYVGGWFSHASGVEVSNIARWDGSAWSALNGPSGTGVGGGWFPIPSVVSLVVYDDGSGPALYAGGEFKTAGGIASSRIAAWRCDPDTTQPTDPISLVSTTHTPDVWSSLNVVDVEWSGAADSGGSGLAGYSLLWDTSPATLPDDTIEVQHVAEPHSTSSGVLADGDSHWFHLRTCDNAGNCSGGTHLGPFLIETAAPSDPADLLSTSHTAGVWSSTNVVDVEWSGAADSGGSGLAGYSVLWDTSPATVPDDTLEVPHTADPHATSSGVLADGSSHWFHLRTCDNAGNCSAGLHLGPFLIDTTQPSGPTDLYSTSHTPGEASCDRFVDLSWTAATDAGSGLDGYAWALTFNHEWTCDQVKDLEEGATALTTPELGDWVWYLHVCAADNLGQWGEVVSSGPYPICPLFWDDFEDGTTDAWSAVVP